MWIDCGRTKLQTVRKKFSQSIRPPFFISFCAKDASAVESAEAKCTERMLSYSLHVYGWFLLDRSRSLRFTNVRKKKKKVVCHLHSRPCISAIASANLADVFVLLFIYLYFIKYFFFFSCVGLWIEISWHQPLCIFKNGGSRESNDKADQNIQMKSNVNTASSGCRMWYQTLHRGSCFWLYQIWSIIWEHEWTTSIVWPQRNKQNWVARGGSCQHQFPRSHLVATAGTHGTRNVLFVQQQTDRVDIILLI